jgi:1,2-diacylglycerol 3-alpha-glucosyltransferase
MKTLLLLNNAYWPSMGGIENSIRHLSREALERGWRVIVVVSDLGLEENTTNRCCEVEAGIEIYRYPIKPLPWLGAINFFLGYRRLKAILREISNKYSDAIVVSRFHLATLAAVEGGYKDVTYLVPASMDAQYSAEISTHNRVKKISIVLKRWLHLQYQKRSLQRSRVFVFSELMQTQCDDLVPGLLPQITVTKPGVDSDRFYVPSSNEREALRANLSLPIEKPLILFAGRFVYAKGVHVLISALGKLPEACELVLVGEGAAEKEYCEQISLLNLGNRVHIRKATQQVEDYFRACDVFVMSSNYEPLGQTILEALASGLPIAAFSEAAGVMTATEELGFNEYIAYADRYDSGDLAQCIERQLNMAEEKRREQAELAQRTYSWSKLLDNLIS